MIWVLFLPQKSICDTDLIFNFIWIFATFYRMRWARKEIFTIDIALEANYMYFNQLIYVYYKPIRLGIILISWINETFVNVIHFGQNLKNLSPYLLSYDCCKNISVYYGVFTLVKFVEVKVYYLQWKCAYRGGRNCLTDLRPQRYSVFRWRSTWPFF